MSLEAPAAETPGAPLTPALQGPMSPQGRGVLAALFRRYEAWLRRRLRILYGADAAEDLVQEAFLRAARYSEAGSKVHFPKALLLRIARNAATSAAAQARSRRPHLNLEQWAEAEPERTGQGAPQDDALALKQVILSMPVAWRDVFVLSRFLGLTYGQIAGRLGLSVKTVEWRMSKALAHCARALDEGL